MYRQSSQTLRPITTDIRVDGVVTIICCVVNDAATHWVLNIMNDLWCPSRRSKKRTLVVW